MMDIQMNAIDIGEVSQVSSVGISSDGFFVNNIIFNDQKFQEYLVEKFQDTISSFLALPYNIVIDGGTNPYVYMSI